MGNLIVVIVLMLGIVAIAQLMRVYELSAQLRGKKEEEISHGDNVFNARMMLLFMISLYIFFFWLIATYGNGGLGLSASEHGRDLDWMMDFNWVLLLIMFFVTTTLLFWFSFKYYHRPDRRAHWFPHNNKLELLWTAVPACVLAVIITYGLVMWNDIMVSTEKKSKVIELYAKQFDWTARYAGEDNQLGGANFRMINAEYNALGLLTNETVVRRVNEIRQDVVKCGIDYWRDTHDDAIVKELQAKAMSDKEVNYIDTLQKRIDDLKKLKYEEYTQHISDKKLGEAREKLDRLQRHILKLLSLGQAIKSDKKLEAAADDDIIAKELHLVKGQSYEFKFRSQDVIHSAFFPHFRAQMNCVPGMITRFQFKPIMTTQEMRDHYNNQKFDYILLCNKICGATHYNMKMAVYVHENAKEVEDWLKTQKTFGSIVNPAAAEETSSTPPAETADTTQTNTTPQ